MTRRTLLLLLAVTLLPTAAAHYGDQIPSGSAELLTTVRQAGLVAAIDGVRWDLGTPNEPFDDVVVFDMDRGSTISLFDVVLADGSGRWPPGHVVRAHDGLLIGRPGGIQLNAVYADDPGASDSSYYAAGDFVYVTTGGIGNLPATSSSAVSVRMTNTTHGPPGSFVRTGDQDRVLVGGAVTTDFGHGAGNASLAFQEIDDSARYEGLNAETLYLAVGNVSNTSRLPAFSLRLYGSLPPAGGTTSTSPASNSTTASESDTATASRSGTSTASGTTSGSDSTALPAADPPNRFVPAPGAFVLAGLLVAAVAARRCV